VRLTGSTLVLKIALTALNPFAHFYDTSKEITAAIFGFLIFGSGFKSKVFEGTIQPEWKVAISNCKLFKTLENSVEIDFDTYGKLH
jgi:hydroxymethylglutaryl-CoA synthase